MVPQHTQLVVKYEDLQHETYANVQILAIVDRKQKMS